MKYVLLSADGEISVFSVPNKVAYNLQKYCLEFCCNWLYQSPEAAKFRVQMGDTVGVCYDEKDFIDYLNQYICDEQSTLIATPVVVSCNGCLAYSQSKIKGLSIYSMESAYSLFHKHYMSV